MKEVNIKTINKYKIWIAEYKEENEHKKNEIHENNKAIKRLEGFIEVLENE